jgi:DNA polymerase III sliding clamp (beta) subunit (PCNA family)
MNGSFTAPAETLTSAVKYAARWLDTKPANPVLGGLVFAAGDGGQLTIASQSELATARANLDVEGDAIGHFIVSGRLIDALVATLTDKPVTFEQTGSVITMTAGRYKAELPAMSANDYPAMADVLPTIGRVEGAALIDAARRAGTMSARDDTQGVHLTGIEFALDEVDMDAGDMAYTLTLTGTDRLRATRETVEWQPGDTAPLGESFVVSAAVMTDAGEAFAGLPVDVGWQGGSVSFSNWSRSLVTRTVGQPGDFPALAGLFKQIDKRTHTVTLDAKTVMVPLKRADQLADGIYRHVGIDLRKDVLTLRSSTEGKGGGGEDIDVEYDGPDCTIITRSAMLHGLLATAPGPQVVLHINPGEYLPVFATSPDHPAWMHLFVPIRHV